jgi:hypothetical protein
LIQLTGLIIAEPESHPLFIEVVLVQVLSETKDSGEKKTANLNSRFTHTAAKFSRLFDDCNFAARKTPR